jgi:hypothetical protein
MEGKRREEKGREGKGREDRNSDNPEQMKGFCTIHAGSEDYPI